MLNHQLLIEKAAESEKDGKLISALKLYKSALRACYRNASAYVDTQVEFTYDNIWSETRGNKKEYYGRMNKQTEDNRKAIRYYFEKDASLFLIFNRMGTIYDKTNRSEKAAKFLKRIKFFNYNWGRLGVSYPRKFGI